MVLVVAGLVVLGLGARSRPAEAQSGGGEPPDLLGIAARGWEQDVDTLRGEAGKFPAFLQVFWTTELDWPNGWAAGILNRLEQRGMTAYVELTTNDLPALASGRKDDELDAMVRSIGPWLREQEGRHLLVAPLPEANLDEHAWGGDPARYRRAFHRVRAAFARGGLTRDHVRFVFAMNGISSPGYDYRQFWPGHGAVDLIGFSKLNRARPWRDYQETFRRHIEEMRRVISTNKPMLITQTGSVQAAGQSRDRWLNDMFTKLADRGQVVGSIYFNRNKNGDNFRVVHDGRVEGAFAAGLRSWSPPSRAGWLFDGSADQWVRGRGGTPAAVFADVAGSPFSADVAWALTSGVTTGCGIDRFCPSQPVTRAQMATFLDRALDLPEAGSQDRFVDDDGSVHESAIERVAAAGITEGCTTKRFCPANLVARAQMASFLDRALDLPPTEQDAFTDDDGSVHEDAINRTAAAGITQGCASDRYCPGQAVRRAQMTALLRRALEG